MTGTAMLARRNAWMDPRRAALLLGVALVCVGLSAPADARASAAKPTVLAVYGLADDDTPIAEATVRVFAGGPAARGRAGAARSRRALAQANGRRADRTYGSGATLLAFRRLPREFVVEVTGGRADGLSVPGTLRADVRNYRSGKVVYVTPVTTMMAAYRAGVGRGSRTMSQAGARRRTYRELRIPRWMGHADLSYSDRQFNGDTFLAAARRAGGIDALIRRLLDDDRAGRRFGTARPTGRAAQGIGDTVAQGAAGLALNLLFTQAALIAGEVAQRNDLQVPGWLLGLFGLGGGLGDEQIAETRRLVEALGKQVTQLQGDVAQAGFSNLVHQTDRTIGQIDYAYSQLALLANMPANDPTKPAFARTIVNYIGTNLQDAPDILNRNLGAQIPLADNLIKSASRTVGQRKFYNRKSAAEVRGIFDYFAAYQVQLAMLLQEFFHAKPDVYSPTNVSANVARIRANLLSQADSLKPDPPENTVIDTKSREMWVTDLSNPQRRLSEIADISNTGKFAWRVAFSEGRFRPVVGPTGVAGVPYADWEMPTEDAYGRLIDGWSGRSPSLWLQKEAGFSGRIISAFGYEKWINYPYAVTSQGLSTLLTVRAYDLYYNKLQLKFLVWGPGVSWQSRFESVQAGRMFKRSLTPGESYWWSS